MDVFGTFIVRQVCRRCTSRFLLDFVAEPRTWLLPPGCGANRSRPHKLHAPPLLSFLRKDQNRGGSSVARGCKYTGSCFRFCSCCSIQNEAVEQNAPSYAPRSRCFARLLASDTVAWTQKKGRGGDNRFTTNRLLTRRILLLAMDLMSSLDPTALSRSPMHLNRGTHHPSGFYF